LLFVQVVNLGCNCRLDVGKGCKVIKSKFDVKVRVCGFDFLFGFVRVCVLEGGRFKVFLDVLQGLDFLSDRGDLLGQFGFYGVGFGFGGCVALKGGVELKIAI
jgi:hypothetical protein